LPPYTGPSLNTETRVEVADHVVPGVVLIVLSVILVLLERQRSFSPTLRLAAGFATLLCGIWMTSTHIPLVAQAMRDEVSAGATAYHAVPSLVVLALGLTWVGIHWEQSD
jgi:Na+-transporting methylmalonyl-CoA/oxaloacetate decarboxylase beta subunit